MLNAGDNGREPDSERATEGERPREELGEGTWVKGIADGEVERGNIAWSGGETGRRRDSGVRVRPRDFFRRGDTLEAGEREGDFSRLELSMSWTISITRSNLRSYLAKRSAEAARPRSIILSICACISAWACNDACKEVRRAGELGQFRDRPLVFCTSCNGGVATRLCTIGSNGLSLQLVLLDFFGVLAARAIHGTDQSVLELHRRALGSAVSFLANETGTRYTHRARLDLIRDTIHIAEHLCTNWPGDPLASTFGSTLCGEELSDDNEAVCAQQPCGRRSSTATQTALGQMSTEQ